MFSGSAISRAKVWLASQICRPWVGRCLSTLYGGRIPHWGIVIDAGQEAVPAEHAASIFFGLYEPAEIRFVRRFLHRGLDVVEIGGGIGVVSAHILTRLGKGNKLTCVEANPRLLPALRRNIELNAPQAQVIVVHGALDYSGAGVISLRVDGKNLGSHVQARAGEALVQVRAMSLRDLVLEAGLGDYALVCDAEGAEAGMILCDSEGLSRCRQMIVEFHPAVHDGVQYSVADLCREAEARHGFRLVAARRGIHVFEKPARQIGPLGAGCLPSGAGAARAI